jgi:hypothetical protein
MQSRSGRDQPRRPRARIFSSVTSSSARHCTSLRPGDSVTQGQPLFVIEAADNVQAQNDFIAAMTASNKARSAHDLAQLQDRRAKDLFEGKAVPLKDYQQSQATLTSWQACQQLSLPTELALDWPGERVGDYLLNVGNDLAVDQLEEWGLEAFTPSVELTAAQAGALNGQKHLVIWGRIPLMHLRHCPLRAAEGMKGRHADCQHCDGCKPARRLDGRAMTDRRGAAFPLKRLAMPGGCVIQVLNSVPLMPLKRLNRLPKAESWRLLLSPGEPVTAIAKVYRAALDGGDFRALPEWETLETMNTTSGHYFRGVE